MKPGTHVIAGGVKNRICTVVGGEAGLITVKYPNGSFAGYKESDLEIINLRKESYE